MNVFHIVSIICLGLCLLMFFYFRWYIKKATGSSGKHKNELDERRTEVMRLIAEIDRITDRDSQLVEERIITLKAIIEDVDKKIALYVKELEKSQKAETLYSSLGRGIRDALAQGSQEQEAVVSDSIELSSQIVLPQAIYEPPKSLPVTIPLFDLQPPEFSEPEKTDISPPSRNQIRSHIDLLLGEGLNAQEIASRLGISIAEVNLAMNLRRK